MENLNPCPFCGKKDTATYTDCAELAACENYCDCGYMPKLNNCVVCDVHKGGCGASSGYAPTIDEAVALWNARR